MTIRQCIAKRIFKLSTRTQPERGGRVRSEVEDTDRLLSSDCRHLLIFVHGFNNRESTAEQRYLRMFTFIEEHFDRSRTTPDALAFFHWPGNEALGFTGALDAANYPIDILRARDSAQRLADYLTALARSRPVPGDLKVALIGHSLGCRLILEMLNRVAGASLSVDVVALMAAAVPVDLVIGRGNLQVGTTRPRRILSFYSRSDWVLWGAFPLGQFSAFSSGIELAPYSEAVGRHGRPSELGAQIETTNGHGEYWTDRTVAQHLSAAVDSTYYMLPSSHQTAGRALPPPVELSGWSLPSWR